MVIAQKTAHFSRVALFAFLLCAASLDRADALEVSVTGPVSEEMRETLQGGSLLFEQSTSETDVSVQEIVSIAQADYQRLLAVLYDSGYFGAIIDITLDGREASTIEPVNPPTSVARAVIRVTPGRSFRFGRLNAAPLAPGTALPAQFARDETATLGVLKETVSTGIEGWRDEGHAKAQLADQSVTARHDKARIDASLTFDPGPRLRFGPLQVSGNTSVRTERIIEMAGLPEGETYSPQELEDAANRLIRAGAFKSVAMIEADDYNANRMLAVTAKVVETQPRRFGFGAEIATIDGLSLSTYWMHRNLLGGAERLRLEAEIEGIGGETGGTDYRLSARFERPATFNEDTNFYSLAEIEQQDQENFFSRRFSIEAGIERIASEKRRYTLGVGVRRATTRDAFGENDYTLLLFPLGVQFDYRDKKLDARKGYFADVDVAPFVALTGADNGVLSTADFRTYKTFGETKSTTLAFRAQIGSLIGPALSVSPADFLFYSGGGGTVRGQDFESLGVTLPNGNLVGGRSFLGFSGEVRFRSQGALGYVGFVDVGYVGSEVFPDGSGEWHSGAGIGIRYDTTIGPIRFDIATPTSGGEDSANVQIYIGIGQSF